jgi:hypothetical protein
MKAKALIVCLIFISLTTFAGPCILSYNIINIEKPFRHAIKVDKVYKNFSLRRPHDGLKPTIASGNTSNLVIHRFNSCKYDDDIPYDVSTIRKEMAAGGKISSSYLNHKITTIFIDGIFRDPPVKVEEIVQKN